MRSRRLMLPASPCVQVQLPLPGDLGFESEPRAGHAHLLRNGVLGTLARGPCPPRPLAPLPSALGTSALPTGTCCAGHRLSPVPRRPWSSVRWPVPAPRWRLQARPQWATPARGSQSRQCLQRKSQACVVREQAARPGLRPLEVRLRGHPEGSSVHTVIGISKAQK